MIEEKLISKIIDENSFFILNKYNIRVEDFYTSPEVYEFVRTYVAEYGQTPDYRTVVAEFEDFEYYAEVSDSFAYLCKTLKGATAKRKAVEMLQKKANDNFHSMNGTQFANWLYDEAKVLKSVAEASSTTGTNYATNGAERTQWYNENKEQRTFSYIPSPYPSLTKWLAGGFELGDMILLMAYSNRGKSWLASHMALTSWLAEFGVIYYSPELSKKQQLFRFDTLNKHFDNVAIRRGTLSNETEYKEYLGTFNEQNEIPFIVKTMEDLPNGLSVDVIEADLQANPNVKFVVVDGFSLMNHGKGKLRESMTGTSRRLRQIFGRYKVAGLVVHQTPSSAEKENRDEDDLGVRTPVPPRLDQYSETIAVIQDSATVLTWDQHDGVGKLLLAKCREPNVNKALDLRVNFNFGHLTEATPVDYF